MPVLYDPQIVHHDKIILPAGGDLRSSVSVRLAVEQVADNVAVLEDRVAGNGPGIARIREVADLAALKALPVDDGDVCRIAAAVYVFVLGDSTPADDVLVVADDGTGSGPTGRWLHVSQPVAGVANGLATLNPGGWLVERATRIVAGDRASVLRVFGTNDGDIVGLLPGDGTGGGLFVWDADGTQAVDDVMVFDHIAGGPGRWLHAARHARGRAYGLAGLDSAGKVEQDPASKGQAGGVAAIGADGEIEATSTNASTAAMKATSAGGRIGRLGGAYGASGSEPSGAEGRLGAAGHGVWALAGNVSDAHAVLADGNNATTTAAAVRAMGGLGPGIEASSAGNVAGKFTASSLRGAINIAYDGTLSGGEEGDLVYHGGALKVYTATGWKTVTVS